MSVEIKAKKTESITVKHPFLGSFNVYMDDAEDMVISSRDFDLFVERDDVKEFVAALISMTS